MLAKDIMHGSSYQEKGVKYWGATVSRLRRCYLYFGMDNVLNTEEIDLRF